VVIGKVAARATKGQTTNLSTKTVAKIGVALVTQNTVPAATATATAASESRVLTCGVDKKC